MSDYWTGSPGVSMSTPTNAPMPEADYYGPAPPPPPTGPQPYPAMLAANNPNNGMPPAPPSGPGGVVSAPIVTRPAAPAGPQPFPGMLGKPPPATGPLSDEEERILLSNGVTPEQAVKLGIIPASRLPQPSATVSSPFVSAPGGAVSAPVVNRGGGAHAIAKGGAPGNPDPFGIGAANRSILGSFDEQKRGIEHQAGAEAARDVRRAESTEQLARTQQEDAAIQHAEQQHADETFAAHMSEVQSQIDDLREKKIDPLRKLHDSGLGALAIVAGVLGGLYQGATKSATNPFLDELNKYANRQLETARLEIDNQRGALGEQMNLLGQMRAIYKDSQLADSQARNLIYESTKQQIEAEALRANDPIEKARAEQAIADVNRQQSMLQKQIGEQARAQAMAAAANQFAQIKAQKERLDKLYSETYDKVFQKSGNAAQAEYEAKRMVVMLTQKGGAGERVPGAGGGVSDPVMNVPQPQQEHAVKELEAKATADKGIEAIRKAFAKYEALPATAGPWDRDRLAIRAEIMGAYKQALGPGMSSDKDAETFLEPLMPQTGSSSDVNARKQALIEDQIGSKIATPILDRYNPGWRGVAADVQHFDLNGKPK